MSWVRIEDRMADHPKYAAIGVELAPLVLALQVRALCYAASHLTDGRLSVGDVTKLLWGFAELLEGQRGATPAMCTGKWWGDLLVELGIWDQQDEGYVIHDYLIYNPSRAQELARRERDASRKARGRSSGNPLEPAATPNGIREESGRPVPVSVPQETAAQHRAREVDSEPEHDSGVAAELFGGVAAEYHEALRGLLRAAQAPDAATASIRALGPGGIHECYTWEQVGRGIFELVAAGGQFTPRRLEAFCRKVAEGNGVAPGQARADHTDADRMRQAREQLERGT